MVLCLLGARASFGLALRGAGCVVAVPLGGAGHTVFLSLGDLFGQICCCCCAPSRRSTFHRVPLCYPSGVWRSLLLLQCCAPRGRGLLTFCASRCGAPQGRHPVAVFCLRRLAVWLDMVRSIAVCTMLDPLACRGPAFLHVVALFPFGSAPSLRSRVWSRMALYTHQ